MGKAQIESSVYNPAVTRPETLERHLRYVVRGLGEITVFKQPGQTGQTLSDKMTPFDLWEIYKLNTEDQESFFEATVRRMKKESPCVVFRWIPPVKEPAEQLKS